uniref:Essential MCU regulator, mitochondrial n=1 Tax=Amazona collaria TaxID=241587 RepID=A0A8B9F0Y2_9PSIT
MAAADPQPPAAPPQARRPACDARPRLTHTPFGLLRVFSVVIPFLYVGTQISKNFAALLEEHDIFVPEDDDDDD